MYIFFTDDVVQVTYLIEVPEQCTQCTLWKEYIKKKYFVESVC